MSLSIGGLRVRLSRRDRLDGCLPRGSVLTESSAGIPWELPFEVQVFAELLIATRHSQVRITQDRLILSNQHLSQLETEIRDAVFDNAGTLVSFRVGAADAAYLAREFAPGFEVEDHTSLEQYSIYLRLLVNGEPSSPFAATTYLADFSSLI